jgi:8-oxo-dGTP pyrophosphatase MutT (NUDIX family)
MHPDLIACFDKNLNPLPSMPRFEAYKTDGVWYGIANTYVVDAFGRLLVSRRAMTVADNPGKWQTCFGGHADPGETLIETAVRELAEEAGITARPDELFPVSEGSDESYQAHYKTYAFLFSGSIEDLKFPDGEISEARWMAMNDYNEDKVRNPETWCNNCNKERQKIILDWLTKK